MNDQEDSRLDALRRYAILDTPPELNFDRMTSLASSIFEHPVCTLSLADRDRHWFKSRRGVDATEMPRKMSFCDQTIKGREVFVVSDAFADTRFAEAPVVAHAPYLRFYAGAPLIAPSGAQIGSLCVLDTVPQPSFSAKKREILADLASTVVDLLEARARQIELARCTEEIAHLAHHDPLTGLPNRRCLVEVAENAMDRLRPDDEVALLYLDLDGFKGVNDRYGHLSGDAVLTQVASRLRAMLPAKSMAARLGGDEFVVFLTGSTTLGAEASALGERLIVALSQPYPVDDDILRVGVSIGIAIATCRGTTLETLLREADGGLYAAKAGGRGRQVDARSVGFLSSVA